MFMFNNVFTIKVFSLVFKKSASRQSISVSCNKKRDVLAFEYLSYSVGEVGAG